MLGSTKLWSPNAATNKNVGGTIIKFGKYRFDVEAGRGLHVAWIMFGRKVNHIPLGIIPVSYTHLTLPTNSLV